MELGVDYFAVYSVDEAYRIRTQISKEVDILIMGMVDGPSVLWAIENDVEFYVFDLERLHQAVQFSKETRLKAKIHIEVETGMNRTGFAISDLAEVFSNHQ